MASEAKTVVIEDCRAGAVQDALDRWDPAINMNGFADNSAFHFARAHWSGEETTIAVCQWWFPQKKELVIENLYVEATHRRRGVGGELLKFLISEAQKKKARKLTLKSDPSNTAAEKFWQKHAQISTKSSDWTLWKISIA